MRGEAVLHPMGWDAFGLPAENEAIKRGRHPRETTRQYAATYRRQMTLMGCSYDWEREIDSSQPDFYRWTQWFFLMLYRRGLAYQAIGRQWYCPTCRTVLANEQVEAGDICWRCAGSVERRDMQQWYFRITAYAEQLLADLETLDWPEHVLSMQRNWIGRSEGVAFDMAVAGTEQHVEVFTTRPDTIYGMTFAVLAPEHPLVEVITTPDRQKEVEAYAIAAANRSDLERMRGEKERTGVFSGAYAVNPVNGRQVPIYVADYVLMSYGSGAIMAVPAHDDRDFAFARRYHLPIEVVISPPDWDGKPPDAPYTEPGQMVNAGPWSGQPSTTAQAGISDWLEAEGIGWRSVQYRLRDWLISRQRYWGAPIPIIHCPACGTVPVPEDQLPVQLPHIDHWEPGEGGQSPLANVPEFVNTTCPTCHGPARRETDTMDGFACSSWYALRFVSPHTPDQPFDPASLTRWGAPDLYVGGAEHATMHLLYARFWTKVMYDADIVPFREPFPHLRNQGMMGIRDPETGQTRKMSKSAANVVTPDKVAEDYGIDALRIYLMFMAPFENSTLWEEGGISGAQRFIQRVWRLMNEVIATGVGNKDDVPTTRAETDLTRARHRFVKRVTADVEAFKFNTAVAALMEFLNTMADHRQANGITPALVASTRTYVITLAIFVPHIAEELWATFGEPYSVHQQPWPTWDEAQTVEERITLVVQVNGKVRDRLTVSTPIDAEAVKTQALQTPAIQRAIAGQGVARVVYVPGRLVNVVTT